MSPQFLRLCELCDPDFVRSKLSYRDRRSRRLCKILTFHLHSCLQSFPAWRSFPMSHLFPSGGRSIRASASASVQPMNIQGWFPLRLTGLVGGGIGMGNTCKPMAVSFQCMTKFTTNKKKKIKKKKKRLAWSPCSPRDSQESSPAPQFEGISSSVLALLLSTSHIHAWLLEKA